MASQTSDVTKIQDEDVLRRMWQETSDFSKKKEIRAHMYKVREQRLKEFYTTGEVARDIQTTSTITTKNSSTKHAEKTHHADSLMDHSFQSLKSKEIRDSESPTKDIVFSRTPAVQGDRGWNVQETKERSRDGKTETVTNVATTGGWKEIEGGVANYAAKNEAKTTVFQDGDDKNFKKAVGTSKTSMVKQEEHGTIGNTSVKSSSTASSTASRYVSEQKSSSTRGYVPDEVLKDPNTKVHTETKTLPDGTRVTTTRYETTGSCTKSAGSQKVRDTVVTSSSTSSQHRESQHHESQNQEITGHTKQLQQHAHNVIDEQRQQLQEASQNVQNIQNIRNERRERHENVDNIQKSTLVHKEHRDLEVADKRNRKVHVRQEKRSDERTVKETSEPKMESVQTVTTTTTSTNKTSAKPTEQIIDTQRSSVHTGERDSSVNVINTNNAQKASSNTTQFTNVYSLDKNRVSVDISPTHDAFVRSLRSVTPDRERRTHSSYTPSPEKKYKITAEKRGSQQYASNETVTKSVHTEYDRRSSSPDAKPVTGKPTEKVLHRTDTYEERVRQILGIAEKKKTKPEKDISDIIANDRANRKPSLPDVARRPAKSPEKKIQEYPAQKRASISQPERKSSLKSHASDIAPQTNWLPSAPRQTPERKTPERVTFSPGKGTATAKEIRKYHGGRRTCSPAIDLEIVSNYTDAIRRKSMSPCTDDMVPRAFTTAKQGQVYSVDFIKVEKEVSLQQRASPERSISSRTTPRSSPVRETTAKKTIESHMKDDEVLQRKSSVTYTPTQLTEDALMQANVKHLKGKQIDEVDEPLFSKKFMYKLGKDNEAVDSDRHSKPSSKSPTLLIEEEIIAEETDRKDVKHKTVKKDLSREVLTENKKITEVKPTSSATSTASKKSPKKKNNSSNLVINLESTSKTIAAGNKISKPKTRPEEPPKCISTKSIIINEAVAEQREIIVDLKRSKSSREDSPEKVWPVQTEEDSGIPRYPDQVQEPDDSRRSASRRTNVNDIIIDEDEEFNRFTELVDTEITDVDQVAETDECLLTVNEKVNKFQHIKTSSKKPKQPASRVSIPEFSVDQALKSDDCLLSVSDKVQKFKNTADQLKADAIPERPKSPRCQFSTTTKTTTNDSMREERRQSTVSEDLKHDECLFSISEKGIKFVDTGKSSKKIVEAAKLSPKPKIKPVSAPLLDESPKSSSILYLTSVGKLQSSENIKKAKALFEVTAEISKNTSSSSKLTTKETSQDDRSHLDNVRRTLAFEDDSVPGYMKQLDRSLRITSPHRESVLELEEISKGHVTSQSHEDYQAIEKNQKSKFGVTLRRTDSDNKRTVDRKDITTIEVNGSKKEVEDVYDLAILETMLETVTNYEVRRRIRAQIRIVKNMATDAKVTIKTYASSARSRPSAEKNISVTENYTVTKKVSATRYPDKVDENILKRPSVFRKDRSPEKVGFKPFKRSPDRQLESKIKKDDRPDWAKERPLRKASESVTPITRKFTSTTTVRRDVKKEASPKKDATDAITSCYGIGPTDDNGMPLFGLKALRAHNKTKVQTEVTRSSFSSGNANEAVGEVTATKYSGQPMNGIQSKTTQRIGTKKVVSNTGRNVDKKTDERTKLTRRNSVKEITQKFIDNDTESNPSERKNSYKAGLILRTSSFNERKSSSRESTPEAKRRTTTGGFLTNTSKVTGIQDVITRMKAEERVVGDTSEDVEARQLLNKFLGSQVILAGMEGGSTSSRSVAKSATASSTTTGSKRTTKVTTTVTENGVPKTNTRTFIHPITQDVLNTIWNEQTLRLLLEQSTEYEERRIIRLRLKEAMAEKEACSEYMEKTLEESQSQGGNVHGESLLLPLLQSALEAPEFEQTADSGTESGEDLRSGLILEVQNALEKLSACLCSESSDISLERRNSLLQLVSKLQTNLVVAPQTAGAERAGVSQERRLSGGRFARRQQRQGRHTVGVTSEELEDARRLMEEFVLSSSQDNMSALQDKPEEKPAFGPIKVNQAAVKNAMPKPFNNSANTSGSSSTVQTPSNESVEMDRLPELPPPLHDDEVCRTVLDADRYCYKQSMSFDQMSVHPKPKLHQTHSLDEQNIELINAVQLAAGIKSQPERNVNEDRTDDDTLMATISPFRQANKLKDGDTVVLYDQGIYPSPEAQLQPLMQSQPLQHPPAQIIPNPIYEEPVVLQTNPIYAQDDVEKSNRFNAKKSRMKRANTIDIPKPSNYYYKDADSDGDLTEPESTHRSNYLLLRGPIRIGNKGAKPQTKVPSFEPKTESDKKFLAFINRQNSNSAINNKISLWDKAGQTQPIDHSAGTNWTRKFGNIKTNFERVAADNQQPNIVPTQARNSARNFWRSAENQGVADHGRNFRQIANKEIVTSNVKVELPQKNYKFEPQPLAVNKFTHNPHESAFKPIHKTHPKIDVIVNIKTNGSTSDSSTPDTPLYLYSPKSFERQSPVHNSVPWSSNTVNGTAHHKNGIGERRVLSLAASKFEVTNNIPPEESKVAPRRLSKEKIITPATLLQSTKREEPTTYVPPLSNAGGVRKLSGQYNNIKAETRPEYVAQSNVKYKSAFAPVPQTRNLHQEQTHRSNYASPPKKFNKPHDVESPQVSYEKYADHQNARNSPVINLESHLHQHHQQVQQQHHQQNQQVQQQHNQQHQHYSHHHHHHPNMNHITPESIPASFHTTSPTVQNIQQRQGRDLEGHGPNPHNQQQRDTAYQHDITQAAHARENEPNVYYNNVTYQPPQQPKRPQYDSQISTESLHEHLAVSSKVMSAPVSQQAVTVTNKPKSRNEHDIDAAFNLRNTLQIKSELKVKSPVPPVPPVVTVETAPSIVQISGQTPKVCVKDEPLSVVTGKFHIAAQHTPAQLKPTCPQQRISPQLSKSDSWHQVVQKEQVARKPSPHASPNARTVMKSKSTHTLGLPKQFEAGMSKDEMLTKTRTMEAYFAPCQQSPQQTNKSRTTSNAYKHRAVNRTKTTQKISTSTTEQIVTTKSFNEGPITRTRVTTRVTQQQIVEKPMTPFAKFRQMDRQNSLNTPPSTPKTPTSGGPMFKFIDPNLSQSASTIKERLLHWCQMKTREYDNIKLDNFSTCWADGLAFCALVHHFLPDAFDYTKLTPNNRRYNFKLAFQVADEKADIAPLLDVDDMVATRRPDWKCVFTYVQSIYRRFKDQD